MTGGYGLFLRFRARPGAHAALEAALMEGSRLMAAQPGCRLHVLGWADDDTDALWVCELWDDRESHDAAVGIPAAAEVTARVMALCDGIDQRFTTRLAGGHQRGGAPWGAPDR